MTQLMEELRHDVSPFTIRSIQMTPERQRYAYHDLDSNGQKELFIASMPDNGDVHVTAFYYMNGTSPELLGESVKEGNSKAHAERLDAHFYTDGTVLHLMWNSDMSEGTGVLYQLQTDNSQAKEVQSQAISMSGSDPAALFGMADQERLDVKQLDWKTFDRELLQTKPSS